MSLTLTAAAHAGRALLTLRNDGPRSLRVAHHVEAGEPHYDWYTVELTGAAGARTLRFTDDRNEAGLVIAELPPGARLEDAIDLSAWALRKANGARPLPPGDYRMRAFYQVDDVPGVWTGRLESSPVPITIEPQR
ncbi:hypothetical protein ACQP2F_09440 [Actinoplanes sp. CA-030573]|uniref:hypothetical protein n=1 Tax=Actinoplanes sp. CA-030573 TaxID=3239898 RepID=UPI003D91AB22